MLMNASLKRHLFLQCAVFMFLSATALAADSPTPPPSGPTECNTVTPSPTNTKSVVRSAPKAQKLSVLCGNQTLTVATPVTDTRSSKPSEEATKEVKFNWNTLIHDLIWPLTIFCLVFALRPQLLSLLDRLVKAKYKDAELEFVSKEANESLNKVAHGGYLGTLNINAIYESIKLNEWATLVVSRMLMRKGLIEVVGNHDFGASPSLEKLIERCKAQQLLPSELIEDLERLREVTFFAEWWNGRVPIKSEWKWALLNCKRIVEALFDHQPMA